MVTVLGLGVFLLRTKEQGNKKWTADLETQKQKMPSVLSNKGSFSIWIEEGWALEFVFL